MTRKQPIPCAFCGKEFIYKKNKTQKFCDKKCYVGDQKLNDYPGRYKNGHTGLVGNTNHMWLGDEAGYHALHKWIRRQKGAPTVCSHCTRSSGRIEWANVSGEYKRDVNDWLSLCKKCHYKMDFNNNPNWVRKGKYWAKA